MRKIGKYTITRKLGAGGMGVVYAAHDPTANRAVALKVLASDDADRTDLRRFEREAWAAARVKHPNTVAVLDAGEADGKPFLVMELIDGQTVGQLVERRGPLPWVTVTKIIISACKGLAAVHAAGLVHRDVKPGNVMISADGVVKLADFGLAKMANRTTRSLTGAGTVGTPHFMSPEQCHNEPVDGRTDIYALGATFYVLLTNATPYSGDHELQVMYAHCNEPVPDPRTVVPNVPPGCAAVVRKAMAKSPADRYQTADDMLAALERVIASNGVESDPTAEHTALNLPPETIPSGPVVPRGWLRDSRVTRRRVLLAIPAAGLIGATGAIAWSHFRNKLAPPEPDPPAKLVPERDVGAVVTAVAVSKSGRWLAVALADTAEPIASGGVKLFDRSTGDPAEAWWGWRTENFFAAAVSPDGSILVAGGHGVLRAASRRDQSDITYRDAAIGADTVVGLAFSPNGKYLAAAMNPKLNPTDAPRPGGVRIWDVRTRSLVRTLKLAGTETVGPVSFAQDGTTLAVPRQMTAGGHAAAVEMWDVGNGEQLATQIRVENSVYGPFAVFARNEAQCVVVCGGRFQFYRPKSFVDTGEQRSVDERDPEVTAVALSADGNTAALAQPKRIHFVTPPVSGEPPGARKINGPEVTTALVFADNDRTLIGGGRDKRVYEWVVPGTEG